MTNKKLLLVNPPFPRKVAGVPLQLLYLAAALRNSPVETKILDLNIKETPEGVLEEEVSSYRPEYVGVTSYSPNYPESLEIMKKVKDIYPSTRIISGGPHEIAIGKDAEKPAFIDHRVTSTFGETELLKILGIDKHLPERQSLFPAYDLLEQHPSYQFDDELFEGKMMTQILTATGCNQKCSFCSAQLVYNPFKNKIVTDNLEKLVELGFDAVFFNDPNFTSPWRGDDDENEIDAKDRYGRTKELMHALINSGVSQNLLWGCQTKATMVSPELLDLMKKAGCGYVTYALENVDRTSLKELQKGVTPEAVAYAIKLSKERGIKTGLYVMFGTKPNAEDNFRVLQKTLDCVEELRPSYISTSILAHYPMIDRTNGKRIHTELDYANQKYSREKVWLTFDEGWGAYHPHCDTEQAKMYADEIFSRIVNKKEVWNNIRMF